MANRFAQYALPQPAPPVNPAPQWQPSNRFGHYIEPTNPAWRMPDTPIVDPKTRYNDSMILKYGPQQWAAAQADAKANAAKLPGWQRSMFNGGMMNWEPEATAIPVGAVVSLRNAAARATGGKPGAYSGDAYRDAIIQQEHDAQDAWAAKHTIANTALNIAGALPTLEGLGAGKFIGGAKSLAGATARSGFVGGLTGIASGAGENYADRGQGALWGGLSGAGLGLGLPAATAVATNAPKIVPRLARGLKQASGELKEAVGIPQPERTPTPDSDAQALKFLQKVAASRGVTPDSIAADPRVQAGLPVKAANLLGKRGVNLATGLAKGPGDAPDILDPVAREQLRSTARGVVSDFQRVAGVDPDTAYNDVQAQADAMRQKAAPLYTQAYSIGGVDSPTLRDLLRRPSMQAAMSKAMRIAAEEGRDPTELGFRWDTQKFPGGTATVMDQVPVPGGGTMMRPREIQLPPVSEDVPVQVENPTMQTWDYAKRGLNDVLTKRYRNPLTKRLELDDEGRAMVGTSKSLLDELTNPDTAWGPDYKTAVDAGGDPIRLQQAFEEGQDFMGNDVHPRIFNQRWNTYSPADRQAFIMGHADDLATQLGKGSLRPRDLMTPFYQQKLETVLGSPDAANDFLNRVQMRADLAKEAARYSPNTNSTTGEAKSANEEMDKGSPFWAEFAKSPNLEGAFGALGKLAVAPARGLVTGFGAPLSPEARLSFANMMMSDPETFQSMLTGAPKAPPVPSLVAPAIAPTTGLLGGAAAYGGQSQ
jgi:hypothetical protein